MQKFPGGPIKFQEISRRVFKFQEISRISRSCRHPGALLKFSTYRCSTTVVDHTRENKTNTLL